MAEGEGREHHRRQDLSQKKASASDKPAAGDKPAESKPAATAPATEATKKPASKGWQAMIARRRACAADWKADKAAGKTAGLKWPKYWSDCNKRKKEKGMQARSRVCGIVWVH